MNLGELIVLLLIGFVIYKTHKYITGVAGVIVVGVVALYISYIIYTHILYGEMPGSIQVPDKILENDKQIEELEDSYKQYEYREIIK